MGQKLVNELFRTLADGRLLWNTIIRPENKRRKHHGPAEPGQKYSDKQTKALAYFACKPKEDNKIKGKGKGREQPASELSRPTRKPISSPTTASSSSAASKSTRRRTSYGRSRTLGGHRAP